MASFLEDLLKKMQNAPHVGIPPVTNPKVPTKVERDAAAFAKRVKNNPVIPTSTGSQLDEILKHMRESSHGGMVHADPAFRNNGNNGLSQAEVAATNAKLETFIQMLREKKAKRKQEQLAALAAQTNDTENTTEE